MSGEIENTPQAGGTAALREAAAQLTALYEREAYRVYNLCLRVSCDRGAAARATEQAFVAQAGDPGSLAGAEDRPPAYLLACAAQAAVRLSPRRPRTDAEDPDARQLLDAVGELRGPERAALALSALAAYGHDNIAWALDVSPERAAELRERAMVGFHAALGVGASEADARLAAWPWADPPPELWESIYPQAYNKLERALAAATGGRAAGRERAEETAEAGRRAEAEAGLATAVLLPARLLAAALDRLARLPGLLRRPRLLLPTTLRGWLVRGGVLAAVLAAFAAVALTGSGGGIGPFGSGDDAGGTASARETAGIDGSGSGDGGEDGDEYDPLTPEELDELRKQELEDLSEYAREQQRKAAQRDANPVRDYKPPRIKPPKFGGSNKSDSNSGSGGGGSGGGGSGGGGSTTTPTPPPPDDTTTSGGSGGGGSGGGGGNNTGGGGNNTGGGGGNNQDDGTSIDDCLRDPNTGQYVCPKDSE